MSGSFYNDSITVQSSSSEDTHLFRELPVLLASAPELAEKGKTIADSGPSPAANAPVSSLLYEDDLTHLHRLGDHLSELSKYFDLMGKVSRDQSREIRLLKVRLRDREDELTQARDKRYKFGSSMRCLGYDEGFDQGFAKGFDKGFLNRPSAEPVKESGYARAEESAEKSLDMYKVQAEPPEPEPRFPNRNRKISETESSLPAAKASSSSEESPLVRKKPKLVPSLPVLAAPAPELTDKGKAIVFSGPSPAAKYPMSSPPDEDDWGHQVVDKLAELSKYLLQQRKISRDQSLELRVLAARLRDRDAELKQSRLKAESYERTIASLRRELASSSIAAQKQRIEYGVTVRQSGYTEGFDVGFESGVRAGYEQFPHSPDMRKL
ncbi:hypothetical protein CASFOL_018541 [Castilleja foliolosa]|uniref:Uncharacterized protein n=1 Tax=Castilleja foliolosa TaxID=1961234 RepID=A0ABD3D520_9LAMI